MATSPCNHGSGRLMPRAGLLGKLLAVHLVSTFRTTCGSSYVNVPDSNRRLGASSEPPGATSESRKVARLAGAIGFDPVFGAEHRQYHRINALRGQARVRSLSPGTAMVSAMLPSQPLRTQWASSRLSLPRFVKRIEDHFRTPGRERMALVRNHERSRSRAAMSIRRNPEP
jgi:hypothetical protein